MFIRNHTLPRPAEHTHSRACAASAMIGAVENLRDSAGGDVDFYLMMQDGMAWSEALGYLRDGISDCRCAPCYKACCYWNQINDDRDALVMTEELPRMEDDYDLAYRANEAIKYLRSIAATELDQHGYYRLNAMEAELSVLRPADVKRLRPIVLDALGWNSTNAA